MKNLIVIFGLKIYIIILFNIDVKIFFVIIIIIVELLIFIGVYFDGMINFFFRMFNFFCEIICLWYIFWVFIVVNLFVLD